jgi:hypothetical protein
VVYFGNYTPLPLLGGEVPYIGLFIEGGGGVKNDTRNVLSSLKVLSSEN